MRFSQLKKTVFGLVPMNGEFWVATVADPSKMAELARCKKTRLRARRLPEVQADPASLFTVAVNEEGKHRFVAADDPVWVAGAGRPAKGDDDNAEDAAPEGGDDSGHGPDDAGAAGEPEPG